MRVVQRILLLFHKDAKHDFLSSFNNILTNGLRRRGIIVDVIDILGSGEEAEQTVAAILHHTYDVALVLNSWGEQNITLSGGDNLFDRAGLPLINWIVDHPVEHIGHLSTKCRHYHMICIDRSHVKFLKKYYPDVLSAHFLPLPVYDSKGLSENLESFLNRKYDVVFSGNCPDTGHIERLFERCPEDRRDFLFFLSEYMLKHREKSYEESLEIILTEVFGAAPDSGLFREYVDLTFPVIPYVRAKVREEAILSLMESDVRLHLYGSGWERFDTKRGNTLLCGAADFDSLPALYKESKIVLNVMPWFRDGSHDRIPAGMFAGAVVLTDHSLYLDEIAEEDPEHPGMLFFNVSEMQSLPELVQKQLKNPERLFEVSHTGRMLAERYFSIDVIVDKLLEIISGIK